MSGLQDGGSRNGDGTTHVSTARRVTGRWMTPCRWLRRRMLRR